jgi:ketosteroid isomerase-like protein
MSNQTQLEQLNEQYIAAFMNAEVNWYRQHLADDFVCIESNGTVLGKQEFLQQSARGPDVADYKLAKVRVRFYGDAALVQATGHFTRKDGTTGISIYTDIYARIDGDWKCVSAQITRAPGQ